MNIDLVKYLSERMHDEYHELKDPGPVVTISREYGCAAKAIAKRLTEELTKKMMVKGVEMSWHYITKEIMAESARELELDPSKIRYVFQYEQKGIIDEVLSAQFTKYYKSDRKIRSTIARVIRNIACEGYVVIVGRGGVSIAHDILKSLHVMLEAPLEWRSLRISEKFNMTQEEARLECLDIDKKRQQFRDSFQGKNTDYTWYDLTLNCMTLSVDEIVKIIIKAVEVKKLL
ncbi:MAG: cytidylate kinase-like family protein [Bacteroidales bacterium]|nr:cytidylate kinase-like family protein [Bacteroidales bacterium]MBN2763466.1 cytidylate kinase-like family protein [Bacteroidales bacterium]